ncbi:uncharacterized protein LOC111694219 [Trichogramma pretiosum]|uniref:uncharacterized protein LOC111694219 n=1 Tax=Trichogramma pretiosum TaxID=7493 RepID=UPI000C719587|nr:uncharacterized protein LOC111694219 [Trichogramma pretiosum]
MSVQITGTYSIHPGVNAVNSDEPRSVPPLRLRRVDVNAASPPPRPARGIAQQDAAEVSGVRVAPDSKFDDMSRALQNKVQDCTLNVHGLRWGDGSVSAEKSLQMLKEHTVQESRVYLYAEEHYKLVYLQRVLNHRVFDLAWFNCPNPNEVYDSRDHSHFTGEYRGAAHSKCNINYRDFMASSLDNLASYLKQQPTLRKVFGQDYDDAQIELLTKKGVFPYEYISSLEKLQETALPPPEQFYSSLTNSDISTKDYEHAKGVWDFFKISNLSEYSDLYLKTDLILLVEVFENFRKTCHEAYELDPAQNYTLPGYSWDAMLLYTQVELELLTDVDMLLFVEKGIRGGVSQWCSRCSEANNRYMGEDYNPEKEDVYLMYYDINNLYGWAMAQYLPYGGFEWSDAKDYLTLPEDSEYGYIRKVNLEYPESLHDSHKDLTLCPEHACPPGSKQRKLLTTLNPKHKYIIHYRSLQQAGPWLKSYIDLNTEKRKNSKNDFEKQQYKLCNNAIFGKTIENVRKRIDVKLVSSWDGRYGAEAQISKPNFHSRAIFNENLVAIQLSKTAVTIDKPVYVGFSILDISKTHLYRFHYDFMRDRFGNNCKVLYTDTDSLVYEIGGQNVYEVMKHKDNINEFDTFDYEKDNPFGMPLLRENSKKIGLMKDELCGKILRRFCGLRSKMYSVDIQNGGVIKKIKDIKSSVVKNTITFDDYLQCLRENTIISREQHNIRSRLHVLRSEKERKIALSPHDDKRYLVPGTFNTLPWSHKDIASEPPAKKPKYN